MNPEELLKSITEVLAELKIPYAITGGFAASVWGNPRSTADIDIIIELMEKNVGPLTKKVSSLDKNFYVDEDMARDAVIHKSEFNFIDPDCGLKVDFFVMDNTSYNKLKIKRAILRDLYGAKALFVSPEDLILSKLIWSKETYSQKQFEDIKTVLRNKEIKLDYNYINKWAEKHGTIEILNKLIEENKN